MVGVVNVTSSGAASDNISRQDLINWINQTLECNLTKIEETCSGAAWCQLMDLMFLDAIAITKVAWNAHQEEKWRANWKLLQGCFVKCKVDKTLDIEEYVKGKFQKNFEFAQWFKKFFDANFKDQDDGYCAIEVRKGQPIGIGKPGTTNAKQPGGAVGRGGAAARGGRTVVAGRTTTTNKTAPPAKATTTTKTTVPARAAVGSKVATSPVRQPAQNARPDKAAVSEAANAELTHELQDLKLNVDGLEKERDFYFGKLRDIEVHCQAFKDSGSENPAHLTEQIFHILYATEDGFAAPDESEVEGGFPEDNYEQQLEQGYDDDQGYEGDQQETF